ncbi:MAG: hypothetical protein R6X32_00295 [Chloroflexota bacterium]
MTRYIWLFSLWLVMGLALTACDDGTVDVVEPAVTEVAVTRVVTAEPSPTPADCTPLPDDMTAEIVLATDTAVSLELTGLQPGESLIFLTTGQSARESARYDWRPARTVGEDGRFAETISLNQDHPSITEWEIKVLHARGVICFEVGNGE